MTLTFGFVKYDHDCWVRRVTTVIKMESTGFLPFVVLTWGTFTTVKKNRINILLVLYINMVLSQFYMNINLYVKLNNV